MIVPAEQAVRLARAGRGEPDLDRGRAHGEGRARVQPRLRRPDVRVQPVRPLHHQRARDTATQLDILSVGGAIANRFDSTPTSPICASSATCALEFPTDEIAFFVAGRLEVSAEPHDQLRRALGRRVNPTPEANNDFMLNALQGFTFPLGTHGRPDADSRTSTAQFGAARRLRLGPRQRRPHGGPRLHAASTTRGRRRCSGPRR